MFAEADVGGERAAATYTLIDTAKLNGLDSEAYLRNVIARMADHKLSRQRFSMRLKLIRGGECLFVDVRR